MTLFRLEREGLGYAGVNGGEIVHGSGNGIGNGIGIGKKMEMGTGEPSLISQGNGGGAAMLLESRR